MEVKEIVKEKYGEAARRVTNGGANGCCGASSALESCCDPITSNLYDAAQARQIPETALKASLGCGNPTALAKLNPGDTVLDLGSGGGIDVLLSARRVGPTGKAYGLDMTDDMLALARENQRKAGVQNVEFLKGEIEHIPLPDNSVDVIISNCVINLSGNKDQVLREAFRVLKPGGRFAVSDVVTRGAVPDEVRKSMLLWVGCIAGALQDEEYTAKLTAAGFAAIEIEPTRIYDIEDARAFLSGEGIDVDAIAPQVEGKFMSAFIRATKPEDEPAILSEAKTQTDEPAILSEAKTQTDEPAILSEAKTQTDEPAILSEAKTQTDEPAILSEAKTQTDEPAILSEAKTQTDEPAILSEAKTQTDEPAILSQAKTQTDEPAILSEAKTQTSPCCAPGCCS